MEHFPEQYRQGIDFFNRGEYFDAHDAWEELWTETLDESRDFYQGLIQMAVSLLHFEGGNYGGAMKLYHSSRKYLAAYRGGWLGVDVERLLADQQTCYAELLASTAVYPHGLRPQPERLPRITLESTTP